MVRTNHHKVRNLPMYIVQFPQGSRIEGCHFVAKMNWPGQYGEAMSVYGNDGIVGNC